MRIEILGKRQAAWHFGDWNPHVVEYPTLTVSLVPRRPDTQPTLYVGPANPNEPWLEVIADLGHPQTAIVFHAMTLRRSLVVSLGLDELIDPTYGPQRA